VTETGRGRKVSVVAWLFVAVGVVSTGAHALPDLQRLIAGRPLGDGEGLDLLFIALVNAAAIAGGTLVLAGASWGRWLLAAWMGFHVVLSFFHDALQVVVHVALFAAPTWILFRPRPPAA
jgi:hypothetical protein